MTDVVRSNCMFLVFSASLVAKKRPASFPPPDDESLLRLATDSCVIIAAKRYGTRLSQRERVRFDEAMTRFEDIPA